MSTETTGEILRFHSEVIIIRGTDGTEIFAGTKGVFDFIDPALKKPEARRPSSPTTRTSLTYCSVQREATLEEMFGFASSDLTLITLTQSQILAFVRGYHEVLTWVEDRVTLFLCRSEEEGSFFVVEVLWSGGQLRAIRHGLERKGKWGPEAGKPGSLGIIIPNP